MLRSRSVSPHRRIEIKSSRFAFAFAIVAFFATARASAFTVVVVADGDAAKRAQAIASELRARGIDVVTEGASGAPGAAGSAGSAGSATAGGGARVDVATKDGMKSSAASARVIVARDGSVRVVDASAVNSGRAESFAGSDADDVVARRVAETIRAHAASSGGEEAAVGSAADATQARDAASATAPTTTQDTQGPSGAAASPRSAGSATPASSASPANENATIAPARGFASAGSWYVSIDDALPIFSLGPPRPLSFGTSVRFGDVTYGSSANPKPWFIDVAVARRFTIGASVQAQYRDRAAMVGGTARAGYVVPLSNTLALWPRVGVSHERAFGDPEEMSGFASRTDLVLDARLVWMLSKSTALTAGPLVGIAVQSDRPQFRAVTLPNDQPVGGFAYPLASLPRITFAVGITGKIGGPPDSTVDDDAGATEPRVFLSVERAMPLLRFTNVNGSGFRFTDVGTSDRFSALPHSPRLAIDVRVGPLATLGIAGSIGVADTSAIATSLLSDAASSRTTSWAVAPRIGVRVPLTRAFAIWPRTGITYTTWDNDRIGAGGVSSGEHVSADVDGFVELSPVRGIGFLVGPSIAFPLHGRQKVTTTSLDVSRGGQLEALPGTYESHRELMMLGLSAGLVLEIP